jgi:hypothetical protein
VLSGRAGTPLEPGRIEGGDGHLQPGAETDDPDDPSPPMRPRMATTMTLALAL